MITKRLGMDDIMVDVETTGVMPDRHAIIQIAAVRFNLETGEVDPAFFNQALHIPPTRSWMESTRDWWAKMPAVYAEIHKRKREPKIVLDEFKVWLGNDKVRLWGKPSHFDHVFLSSYFHDFEIGNPFHFRDTNDVNSFIRGKYFPHNPPDFEKEVPFQGPAHNALFDALHQIEFLMEAMKHEPQPEA